jgi:FkbM family methyltransferase
MVFTENNWAPNGFYEDQFQKEWEEDTFEILEYYKNPNKIYIDIGSWIGPNVLYSSNLFKHVFALEPDPVALEYLYKNISPTNITINNITVIENALSDKNGMQSFGGNGEFGNSMSTLLVSDKNWDNRVNRFDVKTRNQDIIKVKTITIETLLDNYKINPDDIGLIKMDIEGGELYVIPAIQEFLTKYKPPIYVSFHCPPLTLSEIDYIMTILLKIYKNMYVFDNKYKQKINKEEIFVNENLTYETIVFDDN